MVTSWSVSLIYFRFGCVVEEHRFCHFYPSNIEHHPQPHLNLCTLGKTRARFLRLFLFVDNGTVLRDATVILLGSVSWQGVEQRADIRIIVDCRLASISSSRSSSVSLSVKCVDFRACLRLESFSCLNASSLPQRRHINVVLAQRSWWHTSSRCGSAFTSVSRKSDILRAQFQYQTQRISNGSFVQRFRRSIVRGTECDGVGECSEL